MIKKVTVIIVFLFAFITLTSCIQPEQPKFTISLDDTHLGTQFLPGYTYEIKWFTDDTSLVTIDLLGLKIGEDELSNVLNIAFEIDNTGSYFWTVPQDFVTNYGSLFQENGYRLCISNSFLLTMKDISDKSFTIDYPYVMIVSPKPNDLLKTGCPSSITMNYNGESFTGRVDLYKGETLYKNIANNILFDGVNEVSLSWDISDTNDIGNDFRIVVTDISTNLIYSNASTFTIDHPFVTVKKPSISDIVKAGYSNTMTLSYEGRQFVGKVDLYKGETLYKTISENVSFDGKNDVSLSYGIPTDATIGENYKIVVTSPTMTSIYSKASTFKVIPEIIHTSTVPTGGKVFNGDSYNIRWQTKGVFEAVNIYLENTSGYSMKIAENTSNDGLFTWTVPANLSINDGKIVISVANSSDYFSRIDISLLSSKSTTKLSVSSRYDNLNKVIDTYSNVLDSESRSAIKWIAAYHLSTIGVEEEEETTTPPAEEPVPPTEGDTPKSPSRPNRIGTKPAWWIEGAEPEPDNCFDREQIRQQFLEHLAALGITETEEEAGITTYEDADGNTVIVNEESDYDMEIAYQRIGEDDEEYYMSLRFKKDGFQTYYVVMLRSHETQELIHKELMRDVYKLVTPEIDIDVSDGEEVELGHIYQHSSLELDKIEVTFNMDFSKYEGQELDEETLSQDKDIKWFQIPDKKPETVWNFYLNKILNAFPRLRGTYRTYEMPFLDTVDGKKDAFFLYHNSYDKRLTVRIYSPESRKRYNKSQNKDVDKVEESNIVIMRYFQGETEIKKIDLDLNENYTGNMILNIRNMIENKEHHIPLSICDNDDIPFNFENQDNLISGLKIVNIVSDIEQIIDILDDSINIDRVKTKEGNIQYYEDGYLIAEKRGDNVSGYSEGYYGKGYTYTFKEEVTINGTIYPKGTKVLVDDKGNIIKITIPLDNNKALVILPQKEKYRIDSYFNGITLYKGEEEDYDSNTTVPETDSYTFD